MQCIIIIIIIINVLIKVTLNEIRCRGTLQSQWSTLTESTSLYIKAEESVNVTDESRSSWYSSWNGTGGSSDDGGRWRQTRRSEWKRVGDSMILLLLRETSGRRELIAVWAEWSATGCWLNAGDDGLRQRLFVAGFRRGMSELCRAGNEMPIHRVGTAVSARGPATNAGRGEAE